jgi:hypothetical protein
MNTVVFETCGKLETGRGRNVNIAVGRRVTSKEGEVGGRRSNTVLTEVSETFKELKTFQYLQT